MIEKPVSAVAPPLWGLVLAGGQGTRLGRRDKGGLEYHGLAQARWAYQQLMALCERVYVSVRPEQADQAPYADLPRIEDRRPSGGPASGLLAAWATHPDVAWLVLAADLPLVSSTSLRRLVGHRAPALVATAYRHPDGVIEPLCAVWEPKAAEMLESGRGGGSLRRLLETADVRLLGMDDPAELRSVNTPEDDAAVRATLEGPRPTRE